MNENRPKGNQKHIDLSGRIRIEQGLNNGESFRTIARDLNKDPSTISKEVRRHSVIKERKPDAFAPIPCANNYDTLNFYFSANPVFKPFFKKFVTNLLLTVCVYLFLSLIILYYKSTFNNTAVDISRIIKVDFTVPDKPCTILVSSNTCKTKVYLAAG